LSSEDPSDSGWGEALASLSITIYLCSFGAKLGLRNGGFEREVYEEEKYD